MLGRHIHIYLIHEPSITIKNLSSKEANLFINHIEITKTSTGFECCRFGLQLQAIKFSWCIYLFLSFFTQKEKQTVLQERVTKFL